MNKKAGSGVIIGIILGILSLGAIVTLLVVANQRGWFNKETEENQIPTLEKFYIKARDSNLNFTDAHYFLEYTDKGQAIRISEGELNPEEWTEIQNVPIALLHLYCYNKDHYVVKASKIFDYSEIQNNLSKFTCDMQNFKNISVSHTGDLSREENKITLNINVEEWMYKLKICAEWSAGIIYVALENEILRCNQGNWVNWSFYNATTKQYEYYGENFYRCGIDWITQCEYAEANLCKSYNADPPVRHRDKVDSCHYFGKNLHNETYPITFEIKTLMNKSQLDFVRFIIIDSDRRFDPTLGKWRFMDEYLGEDIGISDTFYNIPYIEN